MILFFRYSRKIRNEMFVANIFYWFLVSALIIISSVVILSPVFLRNDQGWILFLENMIIIISLPSLIFISKINPNIEFFSQNKKQIVRKRRALKYLIPTIYVILFLSTKMFWIIFWIIPYGADEGISFFLLFNLLRFNMVSFIPFCGIIQFIREESLSIKQTISIINLKVMIPLVLFTLTGIFSTIGPVISFYINETRKKFIAANIIFYYVFIIGAVTTLFLLFLVEIYKISLFVQDSSTSKMAN